MGKINVRRYFNPDYDFQKAQDRFVMQTFGIILLIAVVIKVLDEIKIKELVFGQ